MCCHALEPFRRLSVTKADLAQFYSIYDNLRGALVEEPFLDMSTGYPTMVVPAVVSNVLERESYGLELAVDWFISDRWKIKGTGPGLSLVRNLVALHGGKIWAESDGEDKVTVFTPKIQTVTQEVAPC